MAYELDENDGSRGGAFTRALIETLHQISTHQTSYVDLLGLLPSLPDQYPQCEGDNKYCLLFTTIPQRGGRFFTVRKFESPDLFKVDAGTTEGVVEGTEFGLYTKANTSSLPLGIFIATSVSTTSCKIAPKCPQLAAPMPHMSYALVSRWENPDAKLAIFIDTPASSTLLKFLSLIYSAENAAPFSIIRAPSRFDADIVLHLANGLVHLTRTDKLIGAHASPHIRADIGDNANRILHILRSAAHFKFYLSRAAKPHPLHGVVTIELYQLKESDGLYTSTGHNLVQDGHAHIILNAELYGVILRNNSNHNVFPSLFYFDPSDYSVRPWYIPPSSTMQAPLRSKSELKVAYGNHDGHAIRFTLRPGEHSDTGFLVLYLSTQYSDMTHVQQDSVFEPFPEVTAQRTVHVAEVECGLRSSVLTIVTVARSNDPEARPSSAVPPARTRSLSIIALYLVLALAAVTSFPCLSRALGLASWLI